MFAPNKPGSLTPARKLALGDCVSIIVGIIIGSGIFGSSSLIAAGVAKTFWPAVQATQDGVAAQPQEIPELTATLVLLGVWCAGGIAAMLGAFTFAELATTYPAEGGVYVFLSRAFGKQVGFLYAWLEFWLIRPGNVAFVALILGKYAEPLLKFGNTSVPPLAWATLAVCATTLLNLLGFQVERWGQNVLTLAKILGLVAVFVIGMWVAREPAAPSVTPDTFAGIGLALVLVMFSFGGWSDLAYVAAEVRDPGRNLLWSLVLGVLLVTVIYLAITFTFVRGLGYGALAASNAPAADLVGIAWGDYGRRAVSLLVCISCLGTIHGMIFTGSRMFYALGSDHPLLAWLGVWHDRLAIPVRSLLAQGIVTLGLLLAFGLKADGLNRLVATTGIFYWGFFAACVLALFALRQAEPERPRPFQVPLYPVLPAVFALICLTMCWSGADFAWSQRSWESLWTVGVLVSGLALSLVNGASSSPRMPKPTHG